MCVNNLSKVALDIAAVAIEPTNSSRKYMYNALQPLNSEHAFVYSD